MEHTVEKCMLNQVNPTRVAPFDQRFKLEGGGEAIRVCQYKVNCIEIQYDSSQIETLLDKRKART
jgi:hypothetical protein